MSCHKNHPTYRPKGEFGTLHKPMTIREIVQENATTKTFIFDADFDQAKPGQFVMAWLPGEKESPFCVAGIAPFMLTIAAVGILTEKIHHLAVGDQLWIRGPQGTFFTPEKDAATPLLIGGGYGAAPLAFLAEQLIEEGQKPIAILGGRTKYAVIGAARFREIGVEVIITTDDGSEGEEGRVTDPARRLLAQDNGDAIYAVGPNPMLQALEDLAAEFSIPCQLSWEEEMGCGMGICGVCEKDGQLLCVEGPVLKTEG
ncbi:MAG: iron-sulfur cluster-binding protein [Alphaproteobacteria bacterium]